MWGVVLCLVVFLGSVNGGTPGFLDAASVRRHRSETGGCRAAVDPRPRLHFTPKQNWMNDPNGLIYYQGEYHLFFQWTREKKGFVHGKTYEGKKSWGHAVSKDMLHWKELGSALDPDEHGEEYSGSAIVDWHNSSGLQQHGKRPPLIVFYTNVPKGQPSDQRMAVSHDRGRTWTKSARPVIPAFKDPKARLARDPKVQWHASSEHWIMVLYVSSGSVLLYRSKNLHSWQLLQDIGFPFAFECPDLMELPVDGDPEQKHWVLMVGDGRYQVADFDGETFSPITDVIKSEFGSAYAGATFNEEPRGRRVQMSWIKPPYDQNHPLFEDTPFVSVQSFPVELDLIKLADGFHVRKRPVTELAALRMQPPIFHAVYRQEQRLKLPLVTRASGGEHGLEIFIKVRMPSAEARVVVDLQKKAKAVRGQESHESLAKLYLTGQRSRPSVSSSQATPAAAIAQVLWDDLQHTNLQFIRNYLSKNIQVSDDGLHNATQMPLYAEDEQNTVHVQVLVDWGTLELYDVQGGAAQAVYVSDLGASFSQCAPLQVSVASLEGGAELAELEIHELRSTVN